MTIGKPFKKGQSGNPGGRPKVVAEVKELARVYTGQAIQTLVSIMTNPNLRQPRESLPQTRYSTEAMASLPSTSPVRVGLCMSLACQSLAKLLRSGLRVLGIGPRQHRVMVQRLNEVRPRSRFRLGSAAVHKIDLVLTPRLTKASVIFLNFFLNFGRETWTIKTKTIKTIKT
jgi:Family of unknown function (DUF5681)